MDKKIKKEMAQEEKAEKKMNGIKTKPAKKAEPTVIEKAQTLDPKGSIWAEPKEGAVKLHKCKNPECPQTGKPQVAMTGYCVESKFKKGKVVELSTVAPKQENKLFKFPSLHSGKYHLVSAPTIQEACYILAENRQKEINPHLRPEEQAALLPTIWIRSLEYFRRAAMRKLQGTPTDVPKGVHGINVADQDPTAMH